MKWAQTALALVCAFALVTAAAATAGVSTKKKPKPKPLALCGLGQQTANRVNGKVVRCKPNPLFGTTVCQTVVTPILQAAFPSSGVPAGPLNKYGPYFNTLGCYWKVGSMPQAIGVQVIGGKGFHTNSLYQKNTQINMQQAWQEQYQEDSTGQGTCGDGQTSVTLAKTTVEGFAAYTMDQCPALHGFKGDGYYKVSVITKYAWYVVVARTPVSVTSSSDLVPIVEKLMAKYAIYN